MGLNLSVYLAAPVTARWSYGGFSRFRERVCLAAGLGNLSDYTGFGGEKAWPDPSDAPIVALLDHSDCEGVLWGWQAEGTAEALQQIVESWPPQDDYDYTMGMRLIGMLKLAEERDGVVSFH